MIKEYLEIAINAYKSYQGTGMYLALYYVCVLYLFIKEENRDKKLFFVYYPMLTLFLIVNPIFCKIMMYGVEDDTYVRLFWTLPMGVTIAYTATKFIKEAQGKVQKYISIFCTILIIICSGKCVYNKENFQVPSSWYKVPTEAKIVTDYIINDKKENKYVLAPETIVAYVRQIDASIKLYYGRRPSGGYGNVELLTYLNSGNVEKVANLCKEENINYIIFKKEVVLNGNMNEYGYKLFAQTYNFDLYKLDE